MRKLEVAKWSVENVLFGALALHVIGHKVSSPSGFFSWRLNFLWRPFCKWRSPKGYFLKKWAWSAVLGKDLKIPYSLLEYVQYDSIFKCVTCNFIIWLLLCSWGTDGCFEKSCSTKEKKEYGIMPRGFIGSGSALLPVWSLWPFRVNEEGSMNTCIHGSFFLYPVKYHGLRSTEKKTTISDNTFHRCGIFFTLL